MADPVQSLAAHLELLEEWGITGFSRDPAWRARVDSNAGADQAATPLPRAGRGRGAPKAAAEASGPIPTIAPPPEATAPDARLFDDGGAPRERAADPAAGLAQVRQDLGDCTRCKLHRLGRTQIVFGVGNPRAELMFVGEGPGQDEDLQGFPFVGRAGQLLTKIIEAMGMRREDVYIANVIKCRPPGNRNPEPDEVATCEPFLFRQIDVIGPKVIVALGTFAAKALLRTNDSISRLRGRAYDYRGARLVPTFHPAFLLRSPQFKRDTWEDMKKVLAILEELREGGS